MRQRCSTVLLEGQHQVSSSRNVLTMGKLHEANAGVRSKLGETPAIVKFVPIFLYPETPICVANATIRERI
jgi:hypothetical protein